MHISAFRMTERLCASWRGLEPHDRRDDGPHGTSGSPVVAIERSEQRWQRERGTIYLSLETEADMNGTTCALSRLLSRPLLALAARRLNRDAMGTDWSDVTDRAGNGGDRADLGRRATRRRWTRITRTPDPANTTPSAWGSKDEPNPPSSRPTASCSTVLPSGVQRSSRSRRRAGDHERARGRRRRGSKRCSSTGRRKEPSHVSRVPIRVPICGRRCQWRSFRQGLRSPAVR